MIYATVSSKQILSKFFRDTRSAISMEGDAIEWIAEALDFMCVTPRLIDKKRILKAIEKELCNDGLMYRYKNQDDFGIPSSSFTICTFFRAKSLEFFFPKTN